MIILHDPDTLLHKTVELLGARVIPALESPVRVEAIVESVRESHHDFRVLTGLIDQDINDVLELTKSTHRADYLDHLQKAHNDWLAAQLIGPTESILPECFVFQSNTGIAAKRPKDIYARAGFYAFDMSSGIMDQTFKSVVASANLALQATRIAAQDAKAAMTVLALCRPPGHHCDGRRAGGYCYINNAALAVSAWRKQYADARIGILDIDYHHGNGTQEIFYHDPKTFYTSIHGEDEFPYYTGAAEETGAGEAIGTNLNLPLKPGSSFQEYQEKLDVALAALANFKPEFLLVSLGFDTFHLDPLGRFMIEADDYHTMADTIRRQFPDVPAVILFEGGYVIEHLGNNTLSFLRGWEQATVTEV